MYSALVPLMVYAFTGTSRQLAVGPVAMISLLVSAWTHDRCIPTLTRWGRVGRVAVSLRWRHVLRAGHTGSFLMAEAVARDPGAPPLAASHPPQVEVGLNGQLTDEECPEFANRADSSLMQYDVCPDAYAELAFLTSFLVGVLQVSHGHGPT